MMKKDFAWDGNTVPIHTFNTVVVGTGAAGFNAAARLYDFGQKDVAMITEGINRGTSRNTGSDKQTYYKLTLSGEEPDSVREMAQGLFGGGCVDGDIALCEAALSAQGFLRLADLGVPFPQNRYGEYIGYKTDHDPRRRATSVGPYTSRKMTEVLEEEVRKKEIPIFDNLLVIRFIVEEERIKGLICLDLSGEKEKEPRFTVFQCENVIYCTGGPAGIYRDSVYPLGHYGGTGVAFQAGVKGQNLTEWQYGLASKFPRWNVSGTYMQVLPRFISTDETEGGSREFLYDFFRDEGELLTKVFLKGYQWPFDVTKVENGSSIIDLLVYLEQKKGRRVFLDYRENPGEKEPDYTALSPEAKSYLEKADACFGTPIQRLLHMNSPAVDFYKEHGVDLEREPLEIALCAQHNNGGLKVDCWWQTNIKGLFSAGEVAGTHGVFRPGGSALNAGQVGSARAAKYIAVRRGKSLGDTEDFQDRSDFSEIAQKALSEETSLAGRLLVNGTNEGDNLDALWERFAGEMSTVGGPVRNTRRIEEMQETVDAALDTLSQEAGASGPDRLEKAFRLRDMFVCQKMYLSAMADYARNGGKSRGSGLYTDLSGKKPYPQLPDDLTFTLDDGGKSALIQEMVLEGGICRSVWRDVRPIPEDDDFFENVWRSFRENGNVF